MVNLVVTIRPRLTTVTSLHHHGMSLTSSTLLVVILCHVTQPRHACSFSSRVAATVGHKLLCAQVLMSLAWWATYKRQYITWYPPTMSIPTLSTPIWSIPTMSISHYINFPLHQFLTTSTSHYINSHYIDFPLHEFLLCQFPFCRCW